MPIGAVSQIFDAILTGGSPRDPSCVLRTWSGAEAAGIHMVLGSGAVVVHAKFGLTKVESDFLQHSSNPDVARLGRHVQSELPAPPILAKRSLLIEFLSDEHACGQTLGAVIDDIDDASCRLVLGRLPDRPAFEKASLAMPMLQTLLLQGLRLVGAKIDPRQEFDAMASILDLETEPGFILDGEGVVIRMNEAAEVAVRARQPLRLTSAGGLRLSLEAESKALLAIIHEIGQGRTPAPAPPGGAGLSDAHDTARIVRVRPRPDAAEGFEVVLRRIKKSPRSLILAVVRHRLAELTLSPVTLREAFGLTETEAALALWIGNGHRIQDFTTDLQAGVTTARWHLGSIFQKMGIARQGDLVRLLRRIDCL